MNLQESLDTMRLVKTGPSLRERIERRIAAQHHMAAITRLQRFREQLERDMQPEPWTDLEAPMVLLLSDVCDALGLNEAEKASILGKIGEQTLAEVLETRVTPRHALLNERQAKALSHVQKHGAISLSAYRQLCPNWSDETLRIDLADLVTRGILAKNGAKRGTYYTATT